MNLFWFSVCPAISLELTRLGVSKAFCGWDGRFDHIWSDLILIDWLIWLFKSTTLSLQSKENDWDDDLILICFHWDWFDFLFFWVAGLGWSDFNFSLSRWQSWFDSISYHWGGQFDLIWISIFWVAYLIWFDFSKYQQIFHPLSGHSATMLALSSSAGW